ncbi:MAG: hypothetical protein U0Y10_11100 [Spirosomataceae bacterium]
MTNNTVRLLGWVITLSGAFALYFPRFSTEGISYDGTTYACIARNMALGQGSFWQPIYTKQESYWNGEAQHDVFYGHPPLFFGIQSYFFKLLGDHWYIESLYGIVVMVLLMWLVALLWGQLQPSLVPFDWLPVGMLFTFPNVRWAITNNILEPTVALFGLCCVWCFFHSKSNLLKYSCMVLGIWGAILVKGPIGLFALAIPFCHSVVFSQTIKPAIVPTLYLALGVLIGGLGMWLYQPAHDFWQHYFDWQISYSLLNNQNQLNTNKMTIGRLYIVLGLLFNFLFVLFGFAVGVIVLKIQKLPIQVHFSKASQFMIVLGLSASLPIMISPKQEFYYLVPSLPFFALGLAEPLVHYLLVLLSKVSYNTLKTKQIVVVFVLVGILTGVILKKIKFTGKHPEQQAHIQEFRETPLPEATLIGTLNRATLYNPYLNLYLQRYHRITLTPDTTSTSWLIVSRGDFQRLSLPKTPYQEVFRTQSWVLLKK